MSTDSRAASLRQFLLEQAPSTYEALGARTTSEALLADEADVELLTLIESCSQVFLSQRARQLRRRPRAVEDTSGLTWRQTKARQEHLESRARALRRARARTLVDGVNGVNAADGRLRLLASLVDRPWAPRIFPGDFRASGDPLPPSTPVSPSLLSLQQLDSPLRDRLERLVLGLPESAEEIAAALSEEMPPDRRSAVDAAVAYVAHAVRQRRRLADDEHEQLVRGLIVDSRGEGQVVDLVVTCFPWRPDDPSPCFEVVPSDPDGSAPDTLRAIVMAVQDWLGSRGDPPLPFDSAGVAVAVGDYPGGIHTEIVTGASFSVPVAAALVACATGQRVDPDAASTGILRGAQTEWVEGAYEKAAAATWRRAHTVLVPDPCLADAEGGIASVAQHRADADMSTQAVPVTSLDDVVSWMFGQTFRTYRERLLAGPAAR